MIVLALTGIDSPPTETVKHPNLFHSQCPALENVLDQHSAPQCFILYLLHVGSSHCFLAYKHSPFSKLSTCHMSHTAFDCYCGGTMSAHAVQQKAAPPHMIPSFKKKYRRVHAGAGQRILFFDQCASEHVFVQKLFDKTWTQDNAASPKCFLQQL